MSAMPAFKRASSVKAGKPFQSLKPLASRFPPKPWYSRMKSDPRDSLSGVQKVTLVPPKYVDYAGSPRALTKKQLDSLDKAEGFEPGSAELVKARTGAARFDFLRTSASTRVLHLVDSSDWIHAAFFAMPAFRKGGMQTNAILGFTTRVVSLLSQMRPQDAVVFAFDYGRTWRHLESPEYKGGRPAKPALKVQLEDCYLGAASLLGEERCLREINMEADDLIAEYATKYSAMSNVQVLVHARDQDFLQLVNSQCSVLSRTKAGHMHVHTPYSVSETFGVDPGLLPDYWALVGQPADNVQGVPGIGKKGARKLCTVLGSLEEIYANKRKAHHVLSEKQFEALFCKTTHDEVFRGRELMKLPSKHSKPTGKKLSVAPLGHIVRPEVPLVEGISFLKKWNFKTSCKRYEAL